MPSIIEAQLLGCLIEVGASSNDPATSSKSVRDLLEVGGIPDDEIRDVRVRCVWRMVREIVDARLLVNTATVFSRGKSKGLLSDTDGKWIGELAAANILTRESFEQLANDLRRGIMGRAFAEITERITREFRSGSYVQAVVADELDQIINNLVRSDVVGQTAAKDIQDQADNWERREKSGTTPGVLSRVKMLDELTTPPGGIGGYPPKFGVVIGNPGVGKNIYLAGSIRAQLVAEPELQIGAAFLEDGSKWLLKRWTALDLEIPVGAVGVIRLSDEKRARLRELEPGYHELLKRVQVYNYRRIRPADLVHLYRVWIHRFGVRMLYLDDFNHFDHKPAPFGGGSPFRRQFQNEKRFEQVAEAAEAMAELADRKEVPIIATAHTTRPESQSDYHRPPRLDEIADSSGIGKVARFALGLWRTKSNVLRATILKNTEGPGRGETLELVEHVESATLDVELGHRVNLDQEAREEKANKESEKEANAVARSLRVAKLRAGQIAVIKAEEAKAAPPPPQLELIPPGST